MENAADRVETTATVFLGLTMGCARCHDHKFDPISQSRVLSIPRLLQQRERAGRLYRNTRNVPPLIALPTTRDQQRLRELDAAIAPRGQKAKKKDEVQKVQKREVGVSRRPITSVMVMEDTDKPRPTFRAPTRSATRCLTPAGRSSRGRPGVAAQPTRGPPSQPPWTGPMARLARQPVDGPRHRQPDLATSFWQRTRQTAENFGIQGEPPSHPELLDWLATELIRNGWDVKAIHRLIVTSRPISSRPA